MTAPIEGTNDNTSPLIWTGYLHEYTEASVISRTAAASTMFLITNFLIALSFGTQRAQFVHRTGFTWPRLCLQRPPLRRFLVCQLHGKFVISLKLQAIVLAVFLRVFSTLIKTRLFQNLKQKAEFPSCRRSLS